jgi:hypothetical protein
LVTHRSRPGELGRYLSAQTFTQTITARMSITKEKEIQMGDNTHNHDQSILPSSLRVINTIVKIPIKPIPLLEDDEFLLIF